LLSVTGGIPKYLEEINPKLSAEDTLSGFALRRVASWSTSSNKFFSDVFLRDSEFYKKIAEHYVPEERQ